MQGSGEAESSALTHMPLQDAFRRTVSPSPSSARNICCDPPHPPRRRHATLSNHEPHFPPLHNGSLQIRVTESNRGNICSCDIYTYLTKAAACTHTWEHVYIFYHGSVVIFLLLFNLSHTRKDKTEKAHLHESNRWPQTRASCTSNEAKSQRHANSFF